MNINLNNLPDEVLFYSNEKFYDFIEQCLGVDEMMLIKLQSIKNIRTLINVPDVLAVLNVKCKELVNLKNRICFIDEDNNDFIVKPGIKAGVADLIEVLKDKNYKYIKRIKGSKSSTSCIKTNNSQLNASLSNTLSSDFTSSISTSTTTTTMTTPNLMPMNGYVPVISDSIEKFCCNTFKNINLKNDVDYFVHLTPSHTYIDGHIKCNCNTNIKIIFRTNQNSFHLYSYFKHIKYSRCSMMKRKKRESSKLPEENNDLSNKDLQINNYNNIVNDDSESDQDKLDDENDCFQIMNNNSTSNNSCSSTRKRLSTSPSSSGTAKKKKGHNVQIHKKLCIFVFI
ncbi:unnamed protein product [Rotaria magnacalcarata]